MDKFIVKIKIKTKDKMYYTLEAHEFDSQDEEESFVKKSIKAYTDVLKKERLYFIENENVSINTEEIAKIFPDYGLKIKKTKNNINKKHKCNNENTFIVEDGGEIHTIRYGLGKSIEVDNELGEVEKKPYKFSMDY